MTQDEMDWLEEWFLTLRSDSIKVGLQVRDLHADLIGLRDVLYRLEQEPQLPAKAFFEHWLRAATAAGANLQKRHEQNAKIVESELARDVRRARKARKKKSV